MEERKKGRKEEKKKERKEEKKKERKEEKKKERKEERDSTLFANPNFSEVTKSQSHILTYCNKTSKSQLRIAETFLCRMLCNPTSSQKVPKPTLFGTSSFLASKKC